MRLSDVLDSLFRWNQLVLDRARDLSIQLAKPNRSSRKYSKAGEAFQRCGAVVYSVYSRQDSFYTGIKQHAL